MNITKITPLYGFVITSEFKGATDYKGEMCIVRIRGEMYKIPWNYDLNTEEMHIQAIKIGFDKFMEGVHHPDEYHLLVTQTNTGATGIIVKE